ncbi:MAG: NAD-glutamate dehydrogenase [Oceanococcus sp.]
MNAKQEQEFGLQLAQIEAIAASRFQGEERDQLIAFIRCYFESVSDEVLSDLNPPTLFAIAAGHYAASKERARTDAKVRVFKPVEQDHGWHQDVTVLETTVSDRPFLVDTIAMAVRAAGGQIRWIIHPVLDVKRDAHGLMQSVSSAGDEGGSLESFIQLHIHGLSDDADLQALQLRVETVLEDLRAVVDDYFPMREKLAELIDHLAHVPPGMDAEDLVEVADLLRWLDLDHFTFLGYIESKVVSSGEQTGFQGVDGSSLGLLRRSINDQDLVAPAAEMDKYTGSRRPVIVTKTNVRSHIHHHEFLDSISVKRFDENGQASGTCRFVGLFSNEVYNSSPKTIPVVRQKLDWVMRESRSRTGSHAHKQLSEILSSLPTDELFQSSASELLELGLGVRSLRETQRLRLFLRQDRYRRFYSCLVYVQRDQYSSRVRERMGDLLCELLEGTDLEHHVTIQRDGLARLQYIVRTPAGSKTLLTVGELERRLQEASRSWDDGLREYLAKILPDADAWRLADRFHGAFPISYREKSWPIDAATDLQYLHRLSAEEPLLVRLLDKQQDDCDLRLKLYVHKEPASLSGVLPTLEHFGLQVMTQRPYEVRPQNDSSLWIQEFDLTQTGVCVLTTERMRTLFEDAFLRTVRNELEDDGFNGLVLSAGLTGRQAALIRTICKYLQQTAWPYSQSYVESILSANSNLAGQLVKLFESQFDPNVDEAERDSQVERLTAQIQNELEAISSLDADRVLRGYLSVVSSTLRTNYFQRTSVGKPKSYISIKLNPHGIAELPRPRPMFETFVYSPEVEGIHLRGGKVARGGLRWSDRRQDFRTEVLGLVKAQMVKNAVIVPVGAKGGFVVKRSLEGLDRDAFMQAGIACYKTFIRGLLDITDNFIDGVVVPPIDVVCLDEEDTYLVVAADKGTATFSDIANGVSQEYDFWLGDAFASGGSAGYDHKKMGITARSAWESVKRNFREIGHDSQSQDFTCVGIGDMAGDVFGNGMLLSEHIKLNAAFNHLHIFIDPDPDPAKSFAERQRLFNLPRSSWTDYNADLISSGGGIYQRSAKQIELSEAARKALGIDQSKLTPTALIHEILKSPVDLLWNGGIGTYVKARTESHLDVGDRANDGLRIDGQDLRCKIVGEGGNLGLTQLGRIEFSLNGGRVITDFNDNAGGVNSSDREVNIKIPLNKLMAEGAMVVEDRNVLLESMTENVANAVLRDSYLQTQALALMQRQSVARIDEHANFMRSLERAQLLDRAIEYLPDDEKLADRIKDKRGLTTPEQAVLLSYGKITLYDAVVDSDLPDDPLLLSDLLAYFPQALAQSQTEALKVHRLRREIIATLVTNQCVNRMGVTFAHRTGEDRGLSPDRAVWAYLAARQIFDSEQRFADIEAMDGQIATDLQYELMERVMGLIKHASQWLLRHAPSNTPLSELIAQYAEPVQELESRLQDVLPEVYQQQRDKYLATIVKRGAPPELAEAFANHHVIGSALDVSRLATDFDFAVVDVAQVYFSIGGQLHLPWLLSSINHLQVEGRWQALARNNLREDVYGQHRQVVARALRSEGENPQEREQNWKREAATALQFADKRLNELVTLGQPDFAALSIAMGELVRLSL